MTINAIKNKKTKLVFVTGGVISSLGKGIVSSSIGALLKARGYKVFMLKIDPYLNIDCGTMNPDQHGEVFVTNDGAETDLDLGHYERFVDINLTHESNITAGKIFQEILENERHGKYLGDTIQLIPHVSNLIKSKIYNLMKKDFDFVIIEIGGTVGDIESNIFFESIRQIKNDLPKNVCYVHCTLVPYIDATNEYKTKPTQSSVSELRRIGIQPDIIVLRSNDMIPKSAIDKISLFSGVSVKRVISSINVKNKIAILLLLNKQELDHEILKILEFKKVKKSNMKIWNNLNNQLNKIKGKVNIAMVGKYNQTKDAYLSIYEALEHAGIKNLTNVKIEQLNSEKINQSNLKKVLKKFHGIVIPGGFGQRGVNGKLLTIKYARKNKIPLLGICLGMQLMCIEYARNVLNLKDADSTEFNKNTNNALFKVLIGKDIDSGAGGTLRLGAYQAQLTPKSYIRKIYNTDIILERHRHRYEFNNEYKKVLFSKDLVLGAFYKKQNLIEACELPNKIHPFFIGTQFHPELTSRYNRPNPLFAKFINVIVKNN